MNRQLACWMIVLALLLTFGAAFPAAAQDDDAVPGIAPSAEAERLYNAFILGNFKETMSLDMLSNLPQVMALFGAELSAPAHITREDVDVDGVPGAWFAPPDTDPACGAIFYLHGGAYYTGSVDAYAAYLAHIADTTAMPVLAIDYRLAPAHPFPAALEDALVAFKWMLANGIDPRRLVIMGDSAGGGLTMATLLALRDDADFPNDQLPAAAVVLSPWADLAGAGETLVTLAEADAYLKWPGSLEQNAADYAASEDPHNPLISPVYADLDGLPPLLIMVGGREILLSDSTRLARRAQLAGVDVTLDVWEGMIHVWPMFGEFLPESGWALDEINDFIHTHIG